MNTNQNNASLELAKRLSETVNADWESGELLEQVTPTTQELLRTQRNRPFWVLLSSLEKIIADFFCISIFFHNFAASIGDEPQRRCRCDFRGLNISVGYYSKRSETCRWKEHN